MNNVPPCANEISPGLSAALPPPTMAMSDAVWCGARHGGRRTKPPGGSGTPAADCTIIASIAVRSSRRGSRPGNRWASIVFPDPGGPDRSR